MGEFQATAAQVSLHAVEDELMRKLPRVLEDYTELIRRLPDFLRLLQGASLREDERRRPLRDEENGRC